MYYHEVEWPLLRKLIKKKHWSSDIWPRSLVPVTYFAKGHLSACVLTAKVEGMEMTTRNGSDNNGSVPSGNFHSKDKDKKVMASCVWLQV